ncbi:MAG: A/G-specific adenine glycosylase, partial [Nanoarchaeota archaeon]|nr:A/G-specific adenine glycosylase [Nanoarchaeota archaeon]
MNLDEQKITSFQTKILNFYKQQERDLPWRNTSNPYYIHLSEIMLQQTQVSRVI